jgi:hypothetical protein
LPVADLYGGGADGPGSIPRLGFNPPRERVPGFEIIDLATLHRRRAGRDLQGVHRVGFHTLTLFT